MISLSINTTNPDYGKDVLNDIIEKYNLRAVSQKNNQGELTANFLNNRIDLVSKELTQAETNVEQYKKLHNIVDVATESAFQTKKRARLEEELLAAETQLEIISLTTDFLRDPANAFNLFPMTVDNEALQANIQSYNDIILARNELIKTASPQNEYLRQMEDRIKALRANILESTYKQRQSAEIALRDVKREMNSLENSLGGIPEQEREYRNLYRQLSIKSEIYMFLLKRSEENAIILANAAPKGLIIDEAYTLSEPLGLSKKMILLLAFCFGLVIPPIFFASRKLIYNRFESREDVERVTDVPILGEMCIDKSGSRLVVGEDATTSSAELFRLMRTNLLFILNDARDKVVLITSTEPGEGKSFISLNLAASMALLGNKVLLIGMDVRRPQLARYLGINPRYGLTQYLSNQNLSLNDIIVKAPETAGLDVIVAGPVPPNPAELLLSEKVDSMFAELRNIYDYIIVDTAPIGSVSDTFTLNRLADASIYVCRANHTSLSALESVNEIYEQHRLKKLSLVINGTNSGKSYGYHSKQ